MLIIGAKGFAKEVLEVFHQLYTLENIAFYDDVNVDIGSFLFEKFPILKSENEAKFFFETRTKEFTIGVGNPFLRYKLFQKFSNLGGIYCNSISQDSQIGSYDVEIGKGTNVLPNVVISNSVKIGMGCIVYYNVIITHDCKVGNFVELSPNAILLGRVYVGDFSHIGANATILPNVKIGKNVIIGAGAVVISDVPDNCMMAGIPAKVIKELLPLNI